MPTISMFYGIIVRMYFAPSEHPPPHFHVYYAEYKGIVDIRTCEISEGNFPKKQTKFNLFYEKKDMYPSVIKVIPKGDYNIFVEFDNNECGILNMEPYLNFGVFHKIKDPNKFAEVRVSFDTVEWGDGIDLDPQFVYDKSIKEGCITSGST